MNLYALQTPEMLQHVIEVDFRVDTLRASLYKAHDGSEKELGNVTLEQFSLRFAMAKFTMNVDVGLKYVYFRHYIRFRL
jgi:vacuolar protein sorting-associated protein 13A/C